MRPTLKVLASTTLAATMLSGAAMAADVSATLDYYSKEGTALATATDVAILPTVTIGWNAQYAVGDVITLTYSGVALSSGTVPLFTCDSTAVQVGFLSRSGNVLTFRVTQVNTGFDTSGVSCTVGTQTVTDRVTTTAGALSAASAVSVSYSAVTGLGGLALDTSCTGGSTCVANFANLVKVVNQFAAVNQAASVGGTKFDAVIDVNADRLAFVDDLDDTFKFVKWTDGNVNICGPTDIPSACNNATPFKLAATASSATLTLAGNFSWVDINGKDGCEENEYANAILVGGGTYVTGSAAKDCSGISYTLALGDVQHEVEYTPYDGTDAQVLPAQTHSAVVVIKYGTSSSSTFNLAAGSWSLNGFSAVVSYMPYGEGISQIIYASNSSSQAGEVSVDGFNLAGQSCSFNAGMMPSGSTASLAGAIKAGFESCYGAGFTGRVGFTIVINIPQEAGDLYTAYNVNGVDRGTVVNSANGIRNPAP